MTFSTQRVLQPGFQHRRFKGQLPNQEFLLTIFISQRSGKGCLPANLGLNDETFIQVTNRHFIAFKSFNSLLTTAVDKIDTRQELLDLRRDEWQDLVELLVANRNKQDQSEVWIAQMIAAGCMGGDHLWRDLGLSSRDSLKELFFNNFTSLAEKNSNNMRWKKFLYKQLCAQEGHFLCRSPTCESCPTYHECFGEEV